jgi:hypothetical protein
MDERWTLAPHWCRWCLGRIVHFGQRYRCANCGAEVTGAQDGIPAAICGCGIQIGEGRLRGRRLFSCAPNPCRTTTAPAEVVIAFGGDGSAPGRAAREAA